VLGCRRAVGELRALSAHILMRWLACSLVVLRQAVFREVERCSVVTDARGMPDIAWVASQLIGLGRMTIFAGSGRLVPVTYRPYSVPGHRGGGKA
jgi:hypothetical protein